MQSQRPYVTSSFPLATWLVMHGMEPLGSVKGEDARHKIVLVDIPERQELVMAWRNGSTEAATVAFRFNQATKQVRDALKEPYQA